MNNFIKINWRVVWYSVVIWITTLILGSIVVLPWFYLVTPFVIFWVTMFYFKKDVLGLLEKKNKQDKILLLGLAVSIAWFFLLLGLNLLEVAGPYYYNVLFYFSDFRNWFLYPFVLLVPFVYCLTLDNRAHSKKKKKHVGRNSVLGI